MNWPSRVAKGVIDAITIERKATEITPAAFIEKYGRQSLNLFATLFHNKWFKCDYYYPVKIISQM